MNKRIISTFIHLNAYFTFNNKAFKTHKTP